MVNGYSMSAVKRALQMLKNPDMAALSDAFILADSHIIRQQCSLCGCRFWLLLPRLARLRPVHLCPPGGRKICPLLCAVPLLVSCLASAMSRSIWSGGEASSALPVTVMLRSSLPLQSRYILAGQVGPWSLLPRKGGKAGCCNCRIRPQGLFRRHCPICLHRGGPGAGHINSDG